MLDDRVQGIMRELEAEDQRERAAGLPAAQRSRAVEPTTARLLFAIVAAQPGCEVLELGGSRGYSALWLGAAARLQGGFVRSVEREPEAVERWRATISRAGLEQWAEVVEADALQYVCDSPETYDVVFIDAEKRDYERLFQDVRPQLEAGAIVAADNVLSHQDELASYCRARQSDPTLSSVTLELDRGVELTTVLTSQPSSEKH